MLAHVNAKGWMSCQEPHKEYKIYCEGFLIHCHTLCIKIFHAGVSLFALTYIGSNKYTLRSILSLCIHSRQQSFQLLLESNGVTIYSFKNTHAHTHTTETWTLRMARITNNSFCSTQDGNFFKTTTKLFKLTVKGCVQYTCVMLTPNSFQRCGNQRAFQ